MRGPDRRRGRRSYVLLSHSQHAAQRGAEYGNAEKKSHPHSCSNSADPEKFCLRLKKTRICQIGSRSFVPATSPLLASMSLNCALNRLCARWDPSRCDKLMPERSTNSIIANLTEGTQKLGKNMIPKK